MASDPNGIRSSPQDCHKDGPCTADPNLCTDYSAPRACDPEAFAPDPGHRTRDPVHRARDPEVFTHDPVHRARDPVHRARDPVHRAHDPVHRAHSLSCCTQDPIPLTQRQRLAQEEQSPSQLEKTLVKCAGSSTTLGMVTVWARL